MALLPNIGNSEEIETREANEDLTYQLVYSREFSSPFALKPLDSSYQFHFISGISSLLPTVTGVLGRYGAMGLVKTSVKVMTPKRILYLLTKRGEIVHSGWLNLGFCNFYPVKSGDVVVGPIWTAEAERGKGLATSALQLALNEMINNGRSGFFYIDTTHDNLAAQHVIEKSGFGPPTATFVETDHGWEVHERLQNRSRENISE